MEKRIAIFVTWIAALVVGGYILVDMQHRLTKVEEKLDLNSNLTIQNSDYITTDARREIEWQDCYEGGGTKVGRIVRVGFGWVVYTPPENIERVLRQSLYQRWRTKDSLRYLVHFGSPYTNDSLALFRSKESKIKDEVK